MMKVLRNALEILRRGVLILRRLPARLRKTTAVCPPEYRRECRAAVGRSNLSRMRLVIYALFILFLYFLYVNVQMADQLPRGDVLYFLYVDIFLFVVLVVHLALSFVGYRRRDDRTEHNRTERDLGHPGDPRDLPDIQVLLPQVFGGFIMLWSVLIAVSEYELTGGVATYIIAVLASSVLLLTRAHVTILLYLVSIGAFLITKRYLDRGPESLLGEYPFLVGLLIVGFTVSRIVYRQYLSEFVARRRLREAQFKLIRQEKLASIGHLSAGIAHEINNPLGYLKSNVSSLIEGLKILKQDDDADAPVRRPQGPALEEIDEMTQDIRVAVDRIATVVRNLLNFARTHSLEEYESYDIHQGIESTLEIAKNSYKYSARLVRDYGTVPLIQCHGGEINQVLLNILVNAAAAVDSAYRGTGRFGTITIRTRSDGDTVTCDISNDGPAIPPSRQEKIFEPFFTTSQTGGSRQGTGLGLSVARHIVTERHHGEIGLLESEARTTFRVELPVRQQ